MSDAAAQLVDSFERCTLPLPEWNHQAHVAVAMTYVLRHEPEEGLDKLRANIQRFNAANRIAQTETTGYHETMTRLWFWAVRRFLASVEQSRPVGELAGQFVRETDRHLNRQYYSRDRFMSWDARLGWVEPDLKPLEPLNGTMQFTIRDNLDGVDGAALKQFYIDAEFDNGRTAEQYAVSFGNSVVRLAYDGDGKLIGVARAIWDGLKCAAIFDVAVLPACRHRGVGRRLMQSLVDGLPNAFIILTTSRGRESFYANFGFEPTPDRFPALVRNDDL